MDNKSLVSEFYRQFFNCHDLTAPLRMVREDYIQHNPGVGQGRQALIDAFSEKFQTDPSFHLEIQMMIAENDMVAVYLKNTAPDGRTRARVVDIYRIEGGMLAEHWDVIQRV